MFQIDEDLTIYITRGDTAFFSVSAEGDGEMYKFQKGDVVRMKVFERKNCSNVAFQKDFAVTEECEKVNILLTEDETKIGDVINKATDYWYEIELNPYTNPQTIIGYDDDGAKILRLFPEGRDLGITVAAEDIPVVDSELSLTSTRPVENQAVTRALLEQSQKMKELEIPVGIHESLTNISKEISNLDGKISDVSKNVNKDVTVIGGRVDNSLKEVARIDGKVDQEVEDRKTAVHNVSVSVETVDTKLDNAIEDIEASIEETNVSLAAERGRINNLVAYGGLTEYSREIISNKGTNGSAVCDSITVTTIFDKATLRIVGLRGTFYNFVLFTFPDELLPTDVIGANRDNMEIFQMENNVCVNGEYTSGVPIEIEYTLQTPCIAELSDIRVAYDGTIYHTAGESVREQIKKVLQAIGGEPSVKIAQVSLPEIGWTGGNNLFSQVVNIEGVTENSKVDLTPSVEQLVEFYQKDVAFVTENDGGTVTVYAVGEKPQNDYIIQATITEVTYG